MTADGKLKQPQGTIAFFKFAQVGIHNTTPTGDTQQQSDRRMRKALVHNATQGLPLSADKGARGLWRKVHSCVKE
jgi:hypothetical protein